MEAARFTISIVRLELTLAAGRHLLTAPDVLQHDGHTVA